MINSTPAPQKKHTETDNLMFSGKRFKKAVDLGPVAKSTTIISAAFSREVVYTTVSGGVLNVIDVVDNKIISTAHLGTVSQVWSHFVAPDGIVYCSAGIQ